MIVETMRIVYPFLAAVLFCSALLTTLYYLWYRREFLAVYMSIYLFFDFSAQLFLSLSGRVASIEQMRPFILMGRIGMLFALILYCVRIWLLIFKCKK